VSIKLIARTVRGVEYIVADEIESLGLATVTQHPREVTFQAGKVVPALAALQTPDDLFLSVGDVTGVGHWKDVVPWLAQYARRWDWGDAVNVVGRLRKLPERRRFDVVASLLGRRNYSRFDVEDEVGSALSDMLSSRYVSRRGDAHDMPQVDLTVRVFINGDRATFALRLADSPLHRRQYKQDAAPGTLHPPMAAALGRLLAAKTGETVVDSFCGDGTIPIEIGRLSPGAVVHGSDRDPARVRNAIANAKRAGVAVDMTTADAGELGFADGTVDLVVTNPPWNIAVDATGLLAGGLGRFWAEVERVLSPTGRMGVIMDADLDAVNQLRRRGFAITLVQSVRLAGRLSEIIVCTPPGRPSWKLPDGIAVRRQEALKLGLVTATGFDSKAQSGQAEAR
jgi:23S rRNA G2445 N2-methylase RlmL